jgi:hypothetical protein
MRFKPTELVSLAVAGLAFAGAAISAFYSYTNRNRELDIKLVEIGIGILRADPKDTGLTSARGWAIQIIEHYSGIAFDDEDRRTLLNKPLIYQSGITNGYIEGISRSAADAYLACVIVNQSQEARKRCDDILRVPGPGGGQVSPPPIK